MKFEDGEAVINSVIVYLHESFHGNKADVDAGIRWLVVLMRACHTFDMPITSDKFPEVLRAYANALELAQEIESKKRK